jgi:hypothetical protein
MTDTSTTSTNLSTEQVVLVWSNVAATLASVILAAAGQAGAAALVPVIEKMVTASLNALEAAKGQPVTAETVEALRSNVVLVEPTK